MDITTLTQLLREPEKHHGPYEATAPKHHWSAWYATYIVARDQGSRKEPAMTASIVIRTPRPEEAFAVRRIAYLDSHRPLKGDVLVAFVDDEPLAALSLADGTIVADPFQHTADVVELLRLRRDGRHRTPEEAAGDAALHLSRAQAQGAMSA